MLTFDLNASFAEIFAHWIHDALKRGLRHKAGMLGAGCSCWAWLVTVANGMESRCEGLEHRHACLLI